jgi:V-type H+-transporting ATPase subunit a
MKMKIAVILGVAQMAFGVCLKAMNAKHFKRRYDFLYEFLPQFILLLSLFGYMDLLIIIKWLTNYDFEGAEPPSVITIMIDMPLNGGKVKGDALIISDGWNQALNNLLLGNIDCSEF